MFRYEPADWPTMEPEKIETHKKERAEKGMSFYDWINADQFIAQVIVDTCQRLIDDSHGYPASLNNSEEWKAILVEMRDGFQAYMDEENLQYDIKNTEERDALIAKYKRAMELFAQYHPNMWD